MNKEKTTEFITAICKNTELSFEKAVILAKKNSLGGSIATRFFKPLNYSLDEALYLAKKYHNRLPEEVLVLIEERSDWKSLTFDQAVGLVKKHGWASHELNQLIIKRSDCSLETAFKFINSLKWKIKAFASMAGRPDCPLETAEGFLKTEGYNNLERAEIAASIVSRPDCSLEKALYLAETQDWVYVVPSIVRRSDCTLDFAIELAEKYSWYYLIIESIMMRADWQN